MEKILAVMMAIVLVAGCSGNKVLEQSQPQVPPPPSFTGGPRIFFPVEAVDFGRVSLGEVIRYGFVFRNIGDAPLTIMDTWIEAKEGCCPPPAPDIDWATLEPGEEGILYIHSVMHEGMGGAHLFVITVKSNDPVEPEKRLYFKAYHGP